MAAISFSGLASGIDTNALIQSLLDQKRRATATPLKARITQLTDTNSAFSDLTNLLSTLNTSIQKFRTLNGGVIANTLTSSDETILSGSASNSATSGSYTVVTSQLAKNATHSFDDRFASSSTALVPGINDGDPEADRTVSYVIGNGSDQKTISVVLSSTSTVDSFVNAFNSSSSNNGTAVASAVNVGTTASPSYAIVINTNNAGTQKGEIVSVSVGASVTGQARFSGTFAEDPATDAEFTVTGITGSITRSSNSVADVIPGVTLNLQDIGTATLTVGQDPSRTTSDVQEFVDAYNAIVDFVAKNNTISRDESSEDALNIFGTLAHTSLDDNILTSLRSALSQSGTTGRTVNILADLGITTERDGTLKFDSTQFKTALSNDPAGVTLITENLGETLGAVNGTIANFIRFNGILDTAINSNTAAITSAQDRIARFEELLSKEQQSLVAQYASLEATIGRLNSQQSALSSLLPH